MFEDQRMDKLHDEPGARRQRPRARPQPETAGEQELSPSREHIVETLQHTVGNAAVGSLLGSARSGKPLPPTVRAKAERKLRTDLGDVSVHTDSAAGDYARKLGAEAVTVGRDVFFRDGAPDPSTSRGARLYVHELTHAAQDAGEGEKSAHTGVSTPAAPAEREATGLAARGFDGPPENVQTTATAGVAYRVPVTDTDRQEAQPAAPAPSRNGASTEPAAAAAAAAAPASPLVALFRASVVDRVQAAAAAITGSPPDPETAYTEVKGANASLRALSLSYQDTDPLLYARLAGTSNGLVVVETELAVKTGGQVTYAQLTADLQQALGMLQSTADGLH